MKLYKLTTSENTTHHNTQWGENVTHTATGKGRELCTNGVIHAYLDPYLAVFMDPMHGQYGASAHLWECDGNVVADDDTRVGCRSLTTIEQVSLPVITIEQRVRFAIYCAKAVYTYAAWNSWAESWLNGTDRSIESAEAEAWEAGPWSAVWATAAADEWAVAKAEWAAATAAAWTEVAAAELAAVEKAVENAKSATVSVAADAAFAAAHAAEEAREAMETINFVCIAHKAVGIEL